MPLRRTSLTFLLPLSLSLLHGEDFSHFEKAVRPLLVDHCYECHSAAQKVKGGLRLDIREGWQAGGDSGPAIAPGKPDDSLLLKAVSYHDRDLKMPPKKALSAPEVAALRQWVAEGAPDPRTEAGASLAKTKPKVDLQKAKDWWSFQPLRKPAIPAVKSAAWPLNAIDRFVLAKLEAAGLQPSPPADEPTLIRRLSFDLAGLPPSLAELDSHIPAKRRIDALLQSPRFGERWGAHWLDITRFAESSGGGRTLPFKDAWRFRDYVIESLNADLPIDQFLTEQLAGDLLPHATAAERRRHLTATGFLVLGPTNYEEQDKQALRMDIIDEQLDTMGKSFLGMTLGCARCHDHKFDPISTRDYYAMAGILRSTRVIRDYKDNVAHWIDTPLPMDGDQEAALSAKEAKLTTLKHDLDAAKGDLKKAGVDSALKRLKPGSVDPKTLEGIVIDDEDAKQIGTWKHSTFTRSYIGTGYLSDNNMDKGAMTLTFAPKITVGGRYEVRFAYTPLENRANNVPVVVFHADGENSIKIDETEPPPIDGRFISLGTYRFEANGEGYVLVSNSDTKDFVTADAVQFIRVADDAPISAAPAAAAPATRQKAKRGRAVDKKQEASAKLAEKIKDLTEQIKELELHGPQRPEAMTVREDDTIEDSPIHIRGQIRNLGEVVPRGFLSVTQVPCPSPPEGQSGRLELARWITHRDNPLTARVLVNRIWLWMFGEGLVRSADNFGTTGETPSHPELLDYLAVEFIESGWDLKHMIRLIAGSRTYQQSSDARSGSGAVTDPENRLLWRQNRRRLDAEGFRDTMLVISHELTEKLGGPNIIDARSVDVNTSNAQAIEYNYVFADTRRSVYTPAFRNKRHELFEAFDFADVNGPTGRRNTSTVAPQALFMLNHPFVMDRAKKAAEALVSAHADDSELVTTAYREILGRPPGGREATLGESFIRVSDGDEDKPAKRLENVALFVHALFASVEFRYLK